MATIKEINRDAKRLNSLVKTFQGRSVDEETEKWIKKEISRLYGCDRGLQDVNQTTVLILLRLNLRFRAIELHQFGLWIETEKM